MVIIRTATLQDIHSIQELNLLLFKKEFAEFDNTLNCEWSLSQEGEAYFKKILRKKNAILLIALEDNKILGYLAGSIESCSKTRILKKVGSLDNMLILEKYRGNGIGTKLVDEFIGWLKKNKISRARVVASFKNKQAIEFYKKKGFFDWDLILEKDIYS